MALPRSLLAHPWLIASVAFGLAFVVYLRTLAPGITWSHDGADSGELVAAALTGGIPHPPGYPTYMLVAGLFARLPFAEPARGVNLLSALCAAGAVALVALALWRLLRRDAGAARLGPAFQAVAALSAALLLAFSPTLWSQAVIAEVYALSALFAACLLLLAVLAWDETSPARLRWLLWGMGLALGLGLGNHLSLALLAPALGVALLWRVAPRRLPAGAWLGAAGFLALGLSVYLALPLRAAADPAINWGDPRTTERFWWLVSGRLYRRFLFAFPPALMPARLSAWAALLRQQFGLGGIGLGLAGLWYLWTERRGLAATTLLASVPFVVYALGYDTADSYVYLIPTYLVFALWIGHGLWGVWRELAGWTAGWRWLRLPALLCLLLPLIPLLSNAAAVDLSSDSEAGDYGRATLAQVDPDALLLTDGDGPTFALWYCHFGLGQRPDVRVVNLALWDYAWYRETMWRHYPDLAGAPTIDRLIDAQRRQRPIYLNAADSPLASQLVWRDSGDLLRLEP